MGRRVADVLRFYLFILFFICFNNFSSFSQNNILTLKDSINFNESNIILKKNPYSIYQMVWYNKKGVIDEEYGHTLKLTFPSRKGIQEGMTIDITTDSLLMQGTYGIFSIWNWSDENNNIEGKIEVIKWKRREVILKMDLLIHDERRDRFVRYFGTRTFKRKKGW